MASVSPRLWLKISETLARLPIKGSSSCRVMPPLREQKDSKGGQSAALLFHSIYPLNTTSLCPFHVALDNPAEPVGAGAV